MNICIFFPVSDSKESACNARDPGSVPGSGRSTGKGNGYSTPIFLPGEFHGQRSLVGYSPWGHKESDATEWTTLSLFTFTGFPGGASGKNPPANSGRHKRLGLDPWVRKIPWRRAWQPIPVFLPGESHGQRSLAAYSPWGLKESDTTEAT